MSILDRHQIQVEKNFRTHFALLHISSFNKIYQHVKEKVDLKSGISFLLFLPSLFCSVFHPTGRAHVILLAAWMNAILKQEDVFAKTMSKASTVRGSSSFLKLYCVFFAVRFPVQKKKMPDFVLIFFRCKPGFFNLEPSNPRGCTPCFCFGHSSVCTNAVGYSVYPITSTFQIGNWDLSFYSLEMWDYFYSILKNIYQ